MNSIVWQFFFFHFSANFFFFDPRLDKKVYISGETASLHVDVKNNSNVDIDSFIVKVGGTEVRCQTNIGNNNFFPNFSAIRHLVNLELANTTLKLIIPPNCNVELLVKKGLKFRLG